jgi:hypothetical protein
VNEGPDWAPVLAANDTLYRRVEVYTTGGIPVPLCLSEHPGGFSRTITMYWDELPNRDNWAFMTTADARDVRYDHFFVRLLEANPARKMGYLVTPDRLLYPQLTGFDSWTVHSHCILADSLEPAEGKWCVVMRADSTATLSMYQDVPCAPATRYTLSYRMKTENVQGKGAYGEVYGSDDSMLARDTPRTSTAGWHLRTLLVETGAAESYCRVFMRMENASGLALFDDVSLVREGEAVNLVSNPGFESNEPWVVYDDPRRHFSDAHGYDRVAGRAPPPYLEFLQRIENDVLLYGWEDRVRLGNHGYHHTPSLGFLEPNHEFQHYDPEGDLLRVQRIFADTRAMGLTNRSLRFWRTPGHKYTASLLDLMIDSNVVFFDAGPVTYPSASGRYTCFMLHKAAKRMCGVSCCWWGDVETDDTVEVLYDMLAHGHLAHIGAHPEQMFLNAAEENYARIDSILASCERSFPNTGYVFPDEWADNAVSIYNLKIRGVTFDGTTASCRIDGAVREGTAAVLFGQCGGASFDGAAVQCRIEGPRTYIILPGAADTVHTLALAGLRSGFTEFTPYNPPDNIVMTVNAALKRVEFFVDGVSTVRLDIFGPGGRRVYEGPVRRFFYGRQSVSFRNAGFAPGIYIIRLTINGRTYARLAQIIR